MHAARSDEAPHVDDTAHVLTRGQRDLLDWQLTGSTQQLRSTPLTVDLSVGAVHWVDTGDSVDAAHWVDTRRSPSALS